MAETGFLHRVFFAGGQFSFLGLPMLRNERAIAQAFTFAARPRSVATTKLAARSRLAFHPEEWKKSMKKVFRNPRSSTLGAVEAPLCGRVNGC